MNVEIYLVSKLVLSSFQTNKKLLRHLQKIMCGLRE